MNGHAEVVKILVSNGADVHREAHDGSTPANLAHAEGHEAVIRICEQAPPAGTRSVDYADI